MKKSVLFLLLFMSVVIHAQNKSVNVAVPGTLSSYFTALDKTSVTTLTITGNIDAQDFKFMRDTLTELSYINMLDATIEMYMGEGGTVSGYNFYMPNSIPTDAFNMKFNLNVLYLPRNITAIENNAFKNCMSLFELHIMVRDPSTIGYVGTDVFNGVMTDFCRLYVPYGSTSNYSSNPTWNIFINISEESENLSIHELNPSAGSIYSVLSAYNLNSIVSLSVSGYMNAKDFAIIRDSLPNLRSLDLHFVYGIQAYTGTEGTLGSAGTYSYLANHLPSISFTNMIETVILPNNITHFDSAAFKACASLTSLNMPSSLKVVGPNSFQSCFISKVIFPKSIQTVGKDAFLYAGIDTVEFLTPSSLTTIDDGAFSYANFSTIALPNGLRTIGGRAFELTKLVSISLPASVNKLGYNAFNQCTKLKKVDLSLTAIDTIMPSAFYYCTALKEVKFPPNLKYIASSSFRHCHSLDFIDIPDGVTLIGSLAFSSTALTSVKLPEALSWIGGSYGSVFDAVSFTSLTFPKNITWMRLGLDNLGDLQFIKVTATVPDEIQYNTFDVNKNTCILYVPKGTLASYLAAPIWQDFLHIVEVDSVVSKQMSIAAGTLATQLSVQEKHTVTNIKLSGTIDVRDILFMRDSMPSLKDIDLKDVSIVEYTGDLDANYFRSANVLTTYAANTLPLTAFKNKLTLKKLTLPSSLLDIERKALYGCSRLDTLCSTTVAPIPLLATDSVFSYVKKDQCVLYVPVGSISAYRSAAVWQDFFTINEKNITTSNKNLVSDNIQIKVVGDVILIEGACKGDYIQVYNPQGQLFVSEKANGIDDKIYLSQKGVFILRIGAFSYKIYK